MDFLDIVYKYRNRFINSEELVNKIENINKDNLDKDDLVSLDNILVDVKNIIKNTKITLDEVEINKRKEIQKNIKVLEDVLNNSKNKDEMTIKFIKENLSSLKEEENIVRDSGNRYEEIKKYLENSKLFKKYYDNISDNDLLNLITHYITVPNPFKLSSEKLNDLIDLGIKIDSMEKLLRLAFSYGVSGLDTSKIVDYFINKRDDYYLIELICAIEVNLDVDKIMNKVLDTNDDKFIRDCGNYAIRLGLFSKEELENKLNEYNN